MKKKSLAELAEMIDGEISGDPNVMIHGLMDIDNAAAGEISFITSHKLAHKIDSTNASAVIAPKGVDSSNKPIIYAADPNLASAVIQSFFYAKPFEAQGVHSSAHVGENCVIPSAVTICPNAVIGDRVKLGERVEIGAGAVVGDGVVIDDDSILHANVTVEHGCQLGKRVIIYSGAVIGSDGFGYATDKNGIHIKRPQVGIVKIEDDVEIGANTTIDRATFGKTLIKRGAKIDNLVMIAHNVEVGEGSILVGQVGIAGSSTLGKGVVFGGKVAVRDHVHIGDRVIAAGKTGITSDIAAGSIISGMPAIPHKKWLRASSIFAKLPDLMKEIGELKKKVLELSDWRNSLDK